MNYSVVIVAAGKGIRANLGYNKNFFEIEEGKTIIDKTIDIFDEDIDCKEIIVVTGKDNINSINKRDKLKVVLGGETRKDSVYNGLKEVNEDYVLIHDGVRPFLRKESLEKLKDNLNKYDALILAHSVVETVKYVEDNKIIKTINRNNIYLAETPQAFKTSLILKAYETSSNIEFTDEAMLVEEMGEDVYIIEDEYPNPKLTKAEDFKIND